MVKGTSRRVIVVDSPDPKLFEQAIFIVKNEAFSTEGVTSQQLLGEACRIARTCAGGQDKPPRQKRIPAWGWGMIGMAAGIFLYRALTLLL